MTTPSQFSTVALVVAAGRGQRFGGELPKQYRRLGDHALIRHCLTLFQTHRGIDAMRVVFNPDDQDLYAAATEGLDLLSPVAGGATRQQSVRNGLESLATSGAQRVLIHDAARPFLDRDGIDTLLAALDTHDGAILGLPIVDTVKRAKASGAEIEATTSRFRLWRALTPQAFRYDKILAAHRAAASTEMTDDAEVAEAAGMSVALVQGREENFKVTTEADLQRAQAMLNRSGPWECRTGNGFDVHRFKEGDFVTICGVRVPHDQALEGHSDADVGLHALTDAILGAIGAGDIGQHFPPSDPKWRGADSTKFLAYAGSLVADKGGRILHCDLTLICERPKIGPHRPAMVARIAEILALAPERVSVKATTTEGLGFTGRREGIAAQATATVGLPPSP